MSSPLERAMAKLASDASAGNVAAVLIGECGTPDLDGVEWEVLVTDGATAETITVGLTGTNGGGRGMEIDASGFERVIEVRALGYALEDRLAQLVQDSPLWLNRNERTNF